MKSWPLQVQVAIWSSLVVAMALAIFGLSAIKAIHEEDLEYVGQKLKTDVKGVFADLRQYRKDEEAAAIERFPANWESRRIEISNKGILFYRSPLLANQPLAPQIQEPGIYLIALKDRPMRLCIQVRNEWTVRLAADIDELVDSSHELLRSYLIALPLVMLVVAAGGWWIARHTLAPVGDITQAAAKISSGDVSDRLPLPPAHDEIRDLTVVLNRMLDRLNIGLRQAQRFSADASHELRTPLAIMRAELEDAVRHAPLSAEAQENLYHGLLDELANLSSMSDKLLLLSRVDAGRLTLDLQDTDFSELVREVLSEAEVMAEPQNLQIDGRIPDGIRAEIDAPRIVQVLRNLLENAVKYNRREGTIRMELTRSQNQLRLLIANTGSPIAQEHRAHLFERYFRGEIHRSSSGHGLGLALARDLARAHGGNVWMEKSDQMETVFALQLPAQTHGSSPQ